MGQKVWSERYDKSDCKRCIFFCLRNQNRRQRKMLFVIQDLLDTLEANRDRCVGMAANMIGVKKISLS